MENKDKVPNDLKKALDAAQHKKVLVIGDVMLDHFIYGAVNRISPESDAPILDVHRQSSMPGGAGNVAVNIRALGLGVSTLGVVGDDDAGKELLSLSEDLIVSSDRPTTVKTRFVSAGGQLLRADAESREDINDHTMEKLLAKAEALMPETNVVILSDYNKGVLTAALIQGVIEKARQYNVPVLVDPKKQDYSLYKGAAVITPNRKELAEVTGMKTSGDEEVTAAANKLMQTGFDSIVVTRSEDGMSVFVKGQEPVHLGNEADQVTDVSGAGDTAIAGLAAGLATGLDLVAAAQLANKAGGLVVAKSGTASIDHEELKGALDGIKIEAKKDTVREALICDWDDAAAEIKKWQAQGLQVGFTNGCFDILHYGHVNYLNRARDKCDRLIVALNHDASVKILKGPDRPLHDQDSRAVVLGALGAVDMVVLFGAEEEGQDNTPCALIEKIRPDIYFKGGDYTIDQLPEAKVMASFGGRTEIMSLYEGHSTTSTIAKMKDIEAA